MGLISGFGLSGYRSFYGKMQLFAPLEKVNLLAGQNNSGKSNVVRFVHEHLKLGRSQAPSALDVPQREAPGPLEYALAIEEADDRIAVVVQPGTNEEQALRTFLQLPALRLTNDNLLWFRFSVGPDGGVGISSRQAEDVTRQLRNERNLLGILSSAFTSHAGGADLEDAQRVLTHYTQRLTMPATEVLEAFRKIGPQGDGGFSGAGLIDRLARLQNPDADAQADRDRFDIVNRFVQTVLEDPTARLEIPYGRNTINIHLQGLVLPLEYMGTGIHQVVILAAAATVLERTLICVEEPEIHLHPLLQRKLIRYLQSETSNQYLIATHSAHLLDYERGRVFHLQHDVGRGTNVTSARTPAQVSMVCADLGYRPSDLLQANAVLWVEGPSDRIYVRHWLGLVAPDLVEAIHYSIMFYGGRLLNHLTATDPEIEEFISLRRLNRHIAILIDSDKRSSRARLNETKFRVRAEFDDEDYPGFAWITDGYTMENYVPVDVLRAAVRDVHPQKAVLEWDGNMWTNPLGAIPNVDKVAVARSVCAQWPSEGMSKILQKHVQQTVQFIRDANGTVPL